MNKTILAFAGRKQSGKSTSAEYVKSIFEQNNKDKICQIYSFADPLKAGICMEIFGLTYDQCYGSDEDKNTMTDLVWNNEPLTARRAMEVIGTDICRKLKNSVWVDATLNRIKKDTVDLAIIPDCRFPNEVDAIKQYGGLVIRLDLDPFSSFSPSESALDPDYYDWNNFDMVVKNKNMTITEKNSIIVEFLYKTKVLGINQ